VAKASKDIIRACYICSSNKYVDGHHYDCQEGRLSPEKVPLCRRCHRTYHDLGVGSFSPDTTEKALEVENKRREILRSLPHDHLQYQRAEYLGILTPLKLEDVERSRYWYKKWGITPPRRERAKVEAGVKLPFRIPHSPPLCGEDWLYRHLRDYTPEEIGALAIEVACGDTWLPPVSLSDKKGKLRKIIKELL